MRTSKFTVGVDFQSAVQSDKSGVGYYTKGMVEALAKEHPEIEIYAHYYSFLNRSPVAAPNLPNVNLVKSYLIHPKLINALRRLSMEIPFGVLIKRRCDAYFFPSFVNYPVSKKSTVITTIHDLAYLDIPESVSKRNREDLLKYVPRYIGRSTKIATVSNHAKSRIKACYPMSPEIFVTYSPPSHAISKKTRSIKSDLPNKYILFVGNLEPRKNLLRLLEAYEMIPSDLRKEHSLVIVGGLGWNNQEIELKIKQLRFKGLSVVKTGYLTEQELVNAYKNAVAFVFPSLYEGYGIPPLEAMSFDVPVLAANIDVLKEVCQDAALYCDPNSVESIAKNLAIILTDVTLRKELIRKGRANVDKITWQKAAKILYKNLTA